MTDSSMRSLAAGEEFRVGRVLGRSFTLLLQNFGKFYLLGLLAVAPMLLLLLVIPTRPGQPLPEHLGRNLGLVFILLALLQITCEAAAIYGAFQAMRGRAFGIGESIGRALQRFFPVLGTGFLLVIVLGIGLVLLVVPGLIFLAMFMLAVPVCVVEGLGPLRSLGRSRELTKGHRWRLFGLYIAVALLISIPRYPIEHILGAVGGTMVAGIVSFLYQAGATAFQLLTFVVAYHDLRVAKEGVDIEHIASVFD
jgi:hypothetical protein